MKNLDMQPITYTALVLLGYDFNDSYYCPPPPAHGGTYRIEFRATQFDKNIPVKGTEEWTAYLTHSDTPVIRRFKYLGELNYFHKGMCGDWLFLPDDLKN